MRLTGDHLDSVLHPQFAGKGKVLAKGLAASPGAAVGKVYFTADDAADAHERGEKVILVRSETSPEDVHGMMASQGILTARGGLVSHAAVVARGWGTPAVVGAEAVKIDGKSVHRRRHDGARGRRHLARRLVSGEVILGALSAGGGGAAGGVPHRAGVGRRGPQGQARRASQRRHRRRREPGPRPSAPRASACAAPSTCSWRPTACPVVRRMILASRPTRRPPRWRSCARSRRSTSRRSSRRWTACPSPCACSTRRCTSSCRRLDELEIKQATTGLSRRGEGAAQGGRELGRVQPDARHARRPPRRAQAGPLRDAGAGADAGGLRAARRGQAPDRRGDDPAHRHPRGDGARPLAGWRRRSSRRSRRRGAARRPPPSRSRSAR